MFSLTVAIVLELCDHTAPSPTQSTHVGVFVAAVVPESGREGFLQKKRCH